MTTTLRRAVPADAASIAAVHVAAWHEAYTGIIPDEMWEGLSVEGKTTMWTDVLQRPDQPGIAVLIAEDDGRAVGFGSCGRQRHPGMDELGFTGEFASIYLLRSHHGTGVSRSIMTTMSATLIDAGHTAASVWTLRQNARARAFYEKLGGIAVDEKVERIGGATVVQKAYGWRDLTILR